MSHLWRGCKNDFVMLNKNIFLFMIYLSNVLGGHRNKVFLSGWTTKRGGGHETIKGGRKKISSPPPSAY